MLNFVAKKNCLRAQFTKHSTNYGNNYKSFFYS